MFMIGDPLSYLPRSSLARWPAEATCLIVLGERHLAKVLREYFDHYNRARPHRALGLRPPEPELIPDAGPIACRQPRSSSTSTHAPPEASRSAPRPQLDWSVRQSPLGQRMISVLSLAGRQRRRPRRDSAPAVMIEFSRLTEKGDREQAGQKETGNAGTQGSHRPRRRGSGCYCARRENRWDAHPWPRRARLPLECR